MARILLLYSTVDGHTRTIADRLAAQLAGDGHRVTAASLDASPLPDVAAFDKVVVGASIRYGHHRENVYEFIEGHRDLLQARPSAFFTVNLVARKPGKDTPWGSPYLRTFHRRTRWRPTELGVFAGRIEYALYGWCDRQVIRFIMWLTRGPTDPRACIEFTDWDAVAAFGRRVSAMELETVHP